MRSVAFLVLLTSLSAPVAAQPALRALDAVWLTPRLLAARDSLTLAAAVGYGAMGRVAGSEGVHHRASGALAVGLSSRLGVALELRLDGRWDVHDVPGGDDGLVGDPRLLLRYGHALGPVRAGLELAVWTPGRAAPSIDWAATSIDLLAVADLTVQPWLSWTAAVGPRFDRSAQSVDSERLLSRSDALSLGVSSFDALLWRLAASTVFGAYRVAAELTADTLLGAGAPAVRESPIRTALTLRRPVGHEQRFEWIAAASCLLSARPAFRADRQVPYESRAAAFFGLRYLFTPRAPAKVAVQTPPEEPVPPVAEAPLPTPLGALQVQVSDASGEALPDAQVRLREDLVQRTNATGNTYFADLPAADLTVVVDAAGFVSATQPVRVQAGALSALHFTLRSARQRGVLRVQVRDLRSGAPLQARCQLAEPGSAPQRFQTDALGRYEHTLAEGRYRVKVSAAGYRAQTRTIAVGEGGVTLFNVDLTPERP